MTHEQQQVKEWMAKFGQETPNEVTIPSFAVRKLRAKLILEEALEAIDALGFEVELDMTENMSEDHLIELKEPNLKLLSDALADLHYVAYCGTAVACGLDMEPIFAEVHRSNESKFWTQEEVSTPDLVPMHCTIEQVVFAPPMDVHIRQYLVTDKDGKVLKSPSYSPADLSPIIESQVSGKISVGFSVSEKNNPPKSP